METKKVLDYDEAEKTFVGVLQTVVETVTDICGDDVELATEILNELIRRLKVKYNLS